MKITFPIGSFYPANKGGTSLAMYYHTKHLKSIGVLPQVITTTYDIGDSTNLVLNKEIDYFGGKILYILHKGKIIPFKFFYNSIKSIIKSDGVHLSGFFYYPNILFLLVSIIFRKPIIISAHGELFPTAIENRKILKFLILKFYCIFQRRFSIHSTSKKENEYSQKEFKNARKYFFEPLAFEFPDIIETERKKQLIFIGRLHEIKNIEVVIKALSISKIFNEQNFIFKIAGDYNSEYGSKLKSLVESYMMKEKIQFIGHCSGKQKENLLAESLALVLLSKSENFGIVVVEAWNQGTPVIVSKGTPWNIIKNKPYLGHYEEGSILNSIDLVLTKILNHTKLDKQLCQKYVHLNFDIKEKIMLWKDIYSKI